MSQTNNYLKLKTFEPEQLLEHEKQVLAYVQQRVERERVRFADFDAEPRICAETSVLSVPEMDGYEIRPYEKVPNGYTGGFCVWPTRNGNVLAMDDTSLENAYVEAVRVKKKGLFGGQVAELNQSYQAEFDESLNELLTEMEECRNTLNESAEDNPAMQPLPSWANKPE